MTTAIRIEWTRLRGTVWISLDDLVGQSALLASDSEADSSGRFQAILPDLVALKEDIEGRVGSSG